MITTKEQMKKLNAVDTLLHNMRRSIDLIREEGEISVGQVEALRMQMKPLIGELAKLSNSLEDEE